MSYYRFLPANLPEPGTARAYEPILMRLGTELAYGFEPITPIRFKPQRLRVIRCTPPMVYGINDASPRVRMRRDAQLRSRRMPTDRYQVICRP